LKTQYFNFNFCTRFAGFRNFVPQLFTFIFYLLSFVF
jgi:hypothetical protein